MHMEKQSLTQSDSTSATSSTLQLSFRVPEQTGLPEQTMFSTSAPSSTLVPKQTFTLAPKAAEVGKIQFAEAPENRYTLPCVCFNTSFHLRQVYILKYARQTVTSYIFFCVSHNHNYRERGITHDYSNYYFQVACQKAYPHF